LIALLIYTNFRYKKYKKALLEELKHTDAEGNPIKTTELDKIFKFSKPIKNVKPANRAIKYAPPPKPKTPMPVRVQPIPLPVQPKPTFVIRQTPVPVQAPVRRPIFANIVNKILPKKIALFQHRPVMQAPSRSLAVSPTLVSISPNSIQTNSRQALIYQNQPQAIP
jgi:hypothetical protein